MTSPEPDFEIIGKTFAGMEPVLEEELRAIGAKNIRLLTRGIYFQGNLELLYRANYACRSAIRFLKPILKFRSSNEHELYKKVKSHDWSNIFSVDDTFSIDAVVNNSPFRHSKYAALKMKDAIADRFREMKGRRPSVDVENPTVRLHLHIHKNDCSVSMDSSGSSLHLRGYRIKTVAAPMNEALAAGLILLTGWRGQSNFSDPMCGSGTFLVEAAMIARSIPAGYYRGQFGFQRWKDYDRSLWERVKEAENSKIKPLSIKIQGSDKSERAIRSARDNLRNAKLFDDVQLEHKTIEASEPPSGGGIAVINPPYGERLVAEDLNKLYGLIGDTFKKSYSGCQAWIISSDPDAMKHVGLKPSQKFTVFNGKLACRFSGYELYEGSRKPKNKNQNGN